MPYTSGTFFLGPARKDSNGSHFQKTSTSMKIYTILSGTLYANITVLRQKNPFVVALDLVTGQDQDRLTFNFEQKGPQVYIF